MRGLPRRQILMVLAPAALLLGSPCRASSGGRFQVTGSQLDAGGGAELSGGRFRARGAAGQTALTAAGASEVLRGGRFQLRDGFYNPPKFTLQNSLSQTFGDPTGAVSVNLPAFSVSAPEFDLVFRQNPIENPLRIDPEKIRQAGRKLSANSALSQVLPGHLWEIDIMDEQGLHGQALSSLGSIAFRYQDSRGDGIVDGTNPPLRAKTLAPWILDENLAMWVKLPQSNVDQAGRRVAAPLRHLSVFAFIGGADISVDAAYAFPVPFRPHGPNAGTGPGQTGTLSSGITFTNLPSEGTIEIYTLSGQLVRRLELPPNLATPTLSWDVRNGAGETVASGVYLWRVISHGNSKTDRLMVIR